MVPAQAAEAEMWEAFTNAIGLKTIGVRLRYASPDGVPAMGGVVEYVN
jgi:hypothetical protein